jgi:DNA-binding NarL/FixJ family response regulator
MNTDPALTAEAFRRGAPGYLLKTGTAAELTTAVREILQGRSYLSPAIAKEAVDFCCTSVRNLLLKQNG